MKTKIGALSMLIGILLLIQPSIDERAIAKLSLLGAKYWPILLIIVGYRLIVKTHKSKYH
ncbi:MAG: hypothetical protein RR929_01460 [Erysipelotrichaceae bacterium]